MAADGMIVMGTQYDADKMVKYTQPKVNAVRRQKCWSFLIRRLARVLF